MNHSYTLSLPPPHPSLSPLAADGMKDMQAMSSMGMAQQQPGQVQDFPKLFEAERENLQMTPHTWIGQGVEERLLKKHGYLG